MECLSRKTVKARKSHQCDACLRRIDAGETYTKQASIYDGEFCVWKECQHCTAFIAHQDLRYIENDEGGYSEDSIVNGIQEFIAVDPKTTVYDLRQCVYYRRYWRNQVTGELYPVPYQSKESE